MDSEENFRSCIAKPSAGGRSRVLATSRPWATSAPTVLIPPVMSRFFSTTAFPKSPAEARELTKGFINAKADFIFFSDGKLPVDIIDAIVDEAKKANMPVVLETVGPTLTLDKGIELGVTQMTHSSGIAKAIAKDPSKWNNELDLYSEMDDAKAQALIHRLVEKKITLTPNFLNSAPGLPKEWPRMPGRDS